MSDTKVTLALSFLGGGWGATYVWMRAERDKWRSMARDPLQQKIDAQPSGDGVLRNDNVTFPPPSNGWVAGPSKSAQRIIDANRGRITARTAAELGAQSVRAHQENNE